jgi:Ca2+-binding RTX toxin-like protein
MEYSFPASVGNPASHGRLEFTIGAAPTKAAPGIYEIASISGQVDGKIISSLVTTGTMTSLPSWNVKATPVTNLLDINNAAGGFMAVTETLAHAYQVVAFSDTTGGIYKFIELRWQDPLSSKTSVAIQLQTPTNLYTTGTTSVRGSISTYIEGTVGKDNITGTPNADVIDGLAGDDTINGGKGNDSIDGGLGIDTLNISGSYPSDGYEVTYNVLEKTFSISNRYGEVDIIKNIEKLYFETDKSIVGILGGTVDADILNGTIIGDYIVGADGDDKIDGGAGGDRMDGGKGNDIYTVDNRLDNIEEKADAGTDTILSSITFSLAPLSNVENLILTGTTAINGTGNSLINSITGNSGNNILDGGAGADTMTGGAGDDTYYVDSYDFINKSNNDLVIERSGAGTDKVIYRATSNFFALYDNVENFTMSRSQGINVFGNSLNNIIIGGVGNDILDGGVGADKLLGGLGDDTYIVDSTTDNITENSGEGTDLVQSSVTFSLAAIANVENLTLLGTIAINGTGNSLINSITGNSGNNILDGGAGVDKLLGGLGSDTYIVDSITDTITEYLEGGTDLIQSSVTFSLAAIANVENLILTGTTAINGTGNLLINSITGNSGNNILDGGAGADTMTGGAGDDTYYVDNYNFFNKIGDLVIESSGAGTDKVIYNASSQFFTLYDNVENFMMAGSKGINVSGNSLNNIIIGGLGNDNIDGGLGADILTGGLGKNHFNFSSANDSSSKNPDKITDFVSGKDQIWFLSTTTPVSLVSGFTGHSNEIIFNKGLLSIDINGDKTVDLQIMLTGVKEFHVDDIVAFSGVA